MTSGDGGNSNGVRDFNSDIEALHIRQNLLEEREIRNGTRLKLVEDTQKDQRDWVVKALGPVMDQLHLSSQQQKLILTTLESNQRQIRKLFAKMDEHGMGRKAQRRKPAKRDTKKRRTAK